MEDEEVALYWVAGVTAVLTTMVGLGTALAKAPSNPYPKPIQAWVSPAREGEGIPARLCYHNTDDIANKKLFVDEGLDGTLNSVTVGAEAWTGERGVTYREGDAEFAGYLPEFEVVRQRANRGE